MSDSTATNSNQNLKPEQVSAALNATKLELALVVALCVIAALLTLRLPLSPWMELSSLALTAGGGAAWVILRTRQALRRLQSVSGSKPQESADGTS